MRFKHYITNEDVRMSDRTKGQLKDYIEKNCEQFLQEFGVRYTHLNFIYRGLKTRNVKRFEIIKVRTDRKPRLVTKELHNYLNKICKKLFGWNVRTEGIFTGSGKLALTYGDKCIFIPIGKYKYVYNTNIQKIYGMYDKFDYLNMKDEPYWEDEKDARKELLELIYNEYRSVYKASGLTNDLNQLQFEAIFKCKEYMVINPDYVIELVDILREILGI